MTRRKEVEKGRAKRGKLKGKDGGIGGEEERNEFLEREQREEKERGFVGRERNPVKCRGQLRRGRESKNHGGGGGRGGR